MQNFEKQSSLSLPEARVTVDSIMQEASMLASRLQKDVQMRKTSMKADESPVTAADMGLHEFLMGKLSEAFPDHMIKSEESTWEGESENDFVWIIDPIDGTSGFASDDPEKQKEFAISVALTRKNKPILGAVAVPSKEVIMSAFSGGGAFLNGEKFEANKNIMEVDEFKTAFSSGERKRFDLLENDLNKISGEKKSLGGTVYKSVLVALGEFDTYFTRNVSKELKEGEEAKYVTNEWDVCAVDVILDELGGKLTDRNGDKMIYNKEDPRNIHGVLVARTKEIHKKVSAIINSPLGSN